ncbi:MAG: DUF6687 family protein [Acidimicrobiales bacterium]
MVVRPLRFEGYEDLDDRPHVMVDGAARRSSVATLSHWPQSPTPRWLARDLSAEIVLDYLRLASGASRPRIARRDRASLAALVASVALAEAVTNDHFDEDGVMSAFALVDPASALDEAALVAAAASCGDFGVVGDDRAAQVAFSLGPIAAAAGATGTSDCYRAVLPVVGELLERPDHYERYWREDFAALQAGRDAIATGQVTLSDVAGDLCVVKRVDASGALLPGAEGGRPISEVAINSATKASRILSVDGDRCELTLRYEGWVRYVSRRIPLRPDLGPLAARLSELEPSGVTWLADPVGTIVGRLAPGGEGRTEIPADQVAAVVVDYLATAPPCWDPFRPGGSYVPG